jgi:hypothetical protein
MQDERTHIARFMGMVNESAEQPVAQKQFTTQGLFRENLLRQIYSEPELFSAIWGDDTGGSYWPAFLAEQMSGWAFVSALAVHTALNTQQLECIERQLVDALIAIAKSDEADQIFVAGHKELDRKDIGRIALSMLGPKVILRSMPASEWILKNPKRNDLLPKSLCAYLRQTNSISLPAKPVLLKSKEPEMLLALPTPASLSRIDQADLTNFLKQKQHELGRIPPKNDMLAPAKSEFPQYHVTKRAVFEAHEKLFGKQAPGRRTGKSSI